MVAWCWIFITVKTKAFFTLFTREFEFLKRLNELLFVMRVFAQKKIHEAFCLFGSNAWESHEEFSESVSGVHSNFDSISKLQLLACRM